VKKLKVENLKPEMITGEDVKSEKGMLLIGKGIILTDSIIRQLHKAGVQLVDIEGEEDASPVDLDPDTIRKIKVEVEKEINLKFQNVSHNLHMTELKEIFLEYLINERLK